MWKRLTIILVLCCFILSLSACNIGDTSDIEPRLRLNNGTRKYSLQETIMLFNDNRNEFFEIANLLIDKTTFWKELYEETGWHCYMHNYPRTSEFFEYNEILKIENFYNNFKPYEIRYETNYRAGKDIRVLMFDFQGTEDNPLGHPIGNWILYVDGGANDPTLADLVFSGWIYQRTETLVDGEWFLMRSSIPNKAVKPSARGM